MIICDGEFAFADSGNPNVSRLNVNLYSSKGGTALTLRKNLKDGVFEAVDATGKVNATYATLALALTAGKADALTNKSLTITDTVCDHSGARLLMGRARRGDL